MGFGNLRSLSMRWNNRKFRRAGRFALFVENDLSQSHQKLFTVARNTKELRTKGEPVTSETHTKRI